MTRVCLIVDHPTRDLDGIILLACELVRRDIEVFLVPMYQRYEVFLFQPDLVLVNYVRFANISFVEACKKLGILVGVLDTEGGIRKDVQAFADDVCRYLDGVSLYCVWGRAQFEALSRCEKIASVTLEATGCPRYDFAVPPWRDAVKDVAIDSESVVLVNTNFPIINPQFQPGKKEVQELVKDVGYEEEYVRELVMQLQTAQAEVLKATSLLALRFTDVLFVVRPHPFEDKQQYEDYFAGQANVEVIQTGTVFEWIKNAKLVIHHNCSTAIETFMMGKEPILVRWINAPLLEQPSSVAVSQKASSLSHLEEMLAKVLTGEKLDVPVEVGASRRKVIEDFFYANDGHCSSRAAEAIKEVIRQRSIQAISESRLGYAVRIVQRQERWRRRVQLLVILLAGCSAYEHMRNVLGRGQISPVKRFSVEDVQETLERLSRVQEDYRSIAVDRATREHAFVRVPGHHSSVRIYSTRAAGRYVKGSSS